MVKRRRVQERDEADARERADSHREALLAELKAREAAGRAPIPPAQPPAEPESPTAVDEVPAP